LFAVFELLSNLVIEPLVYGQSIGVSPALLMLAIAFWTWLWGPMGLVLAAPLTVCLAVLGKYVPQFQFFDVLLGDAPVLTAEVHFYQRLVARDLDEALEIVRQQLQSLSFEQVCDRVLVPALVNSRRDLNQGELTHDDARFVVRAIQEIAQELAESRGETRDEASETDEAAAQSKLTILACAAADEIDRVALELFIPLLDAQVARLGVVSGELLVSEIVAAVSDRQPAVVLLAALPPSGLARTRLLCKRLRSRHADLKIIVGRWGESSGDGISHEELLTLGADYVGTSMEQSLSQMNQLTQFLRPESEGAHRVTSSG